MSSILGGVAPERVAGDVCGKLLPASGRAVFAAHVSNQDVSQRWLLITCKSCPCWARRPVWPQGATRKHRHLSGGACPSSAMAIPAQAWSTRACGPHLQREAQGTFPGPYMPQGCRRCLSTVSVLPRRTKGHLGWLTLVSRHSLRLQLQSSSRKGGRGETRGLGAEASSGSGDL